MKCLSSNFFDEKLILGTKENFCDVYNLIFKGKISIFCQNYLENIFRGMYI